MWQVVHFLRRLKIIAFEIPLETRRHFSFFSTSTLCLTKPAKSPNQPFNDGLVEDGLLLEPIPSQIPLIPYLKIAKAALASQTNSLQCRGVKWNYL